MRAGRRVLGFGVVAVLGALCCPTAAQGQGSPGAAAAQDGTTLRNDSDPTRAVLFSIRPEFSWPREDVTQSVLIFRYDQAALRRRRWLPGRRGVILRFEAPIAHTRIADTANEIGVGDAYAQLLVAPYFTSAFAFVVGTGLLMPTATDDLLGTGKWVLAPAAGPVWFLQGRGMFFLKLQNLVSVGGDSSRPDMNALLITPTFIHAFMRRWWALVDVEAKTNWLNDERTGVKTGLQLGRSIGPHLGLWVKPEVWWEPDQEGRWNLKFGVVWYRGQGAS
jgi:hypothetical protein